MKLEELIAEARFRMDDEVGPTHFVTDEALTRFANEAEREACYRARLLFDATARPGITTIDVEADQDEYPIDPLVFWIDSATFKRDAGGRPCELDLRGLDWIQKRRGGQWASAVRPDVLADNGSDRIRLWPAPSLPGTLKLRVYRYPLERMTEPDDTPEIRGEHHEGLVDWMLYRAYSRPDPDSENGPKAAEALGAFTARFGTRESADVARKHRERRISTTRYGGL